MHFFAAEAHADRRFAVPSVCPHLLLYLVCPWAPEGFSSRDGQIHRRSHENFLSGCTFFLKKVDDLF